MERRSRVQIIEVRAAAVSRPRVVVALPDAGLVGLIATSYLVQQLKLKEIGYVDSELFPQVVAVHGSEPKSPIRIFGNEGERLVVFLSEIPLASRPSYEFANELENWAKSKGAEIVVGVSGMPSKKRMESEKETKPGVFGVSNDKAVTQTLKGHGVQLFQEGVIAGTHATLLKQGMALNVPNLTLLAESYPEFPDPSAAAAAIEALNGLLSISIDIKPLMEESEEVRLRMRDLMRRTKQTMERTEAPSVYA